MIIKAALFLIVGTIAYVAGTSDLKKMGGFLHDYPLLGWILFIATFVLAGIPPFSGFIGKLLLLKGSFEAEHLTVLIIGLITSLLILYSVIRIFIQAFWGERPKDRQIRNIKSFYAPIVFLLIFSIGLGIGAEFFYPYVSDVANYLLDPEIYINSVLKE